MCDCADMVRTFDEMQGDLKGIQPSKHHPACEDYELKTYKRVTFGGCGPAIILDPDKVEEFIRLEVECGSDADDFEVTDIQLTHDQVDNLPEFDGF